jgi:hypothetical protein
VAKSQSIGNLTWLNIRWDVAWKNKVKQIQVSQSNCLNMGCQGVDFSRFAIDAAAGST